MQDQTQQDDAAKAITIPTPIFELSGAALDWAVAKALGAVVKDHQFCGAPNSQVWKNCIVFRDGRAYSRFQPSTDWAVGGPLIEQFNIRCGTRTVCYAMIDDGVRLRSITRGKTVLEAVCRCIVMDELGEQVSVPSELLLGALLPAPAAID